MVQTTSETGPKPAPFRVFGIFTGR